MTAVETLVPQSAAETDADWWRHAVVYQVYPRSFADADGDGIGDLAGVVSRLDYLSDLGIDAIWLSPFYPSPQADGGYDISDYRDVAPELGTLDDFDRLVTGAHARGIKIIVDIVPNHTSIDHTWFKEALLAEPDSPERDRYIFREGAGPLGAAPPTDWRSHFGGSAWQRVTDGQWYLHLFAPEQPDLNWSNPEVRAYFIETLRFWADRGVDGFRIDVAHSLAKDLSEPLRSQPHLDSRLPDDGTDPLYDREEVHTIYEEWRQVFDEYDPPRMAVAETWTPISERTFLYARPTELGQVFDFSLLKSSWDRDSFRSVIVRSIANHGRAGGTPTWVLSNHDSPRHASRLDLPVGRDAEEWVTTDGLIPPIDPERGLRRARAATLMMLALPGSAYLYQGEELGLREVTDLPADALRDPIWTRSDFTRKGRDGCRVPLPWARDGRSYGFGEGRPWLPQPEWFADSSVEAQLQQADSTLLLYRSAIRLRRTHAALRSTVLTFDQGESSDVLSFLRGGRIRCVVNFGAEPIRLPPGRLLISSTPSELGFLQAESTAWVESAE